MSPSLTSSTLFHSLFLQSGGNIFGDYKGSYDPVMSLVFSVLITLLSVGLVGYLAWSYYLRVIRFRQICTRSGLTAEQVSFLQMFIQKFRIEYPAALIEKQTQFDSFSNRIAETYHRDSSVVEMQEDAFQLYTIRAQLKFRHGLHNVKYIRSSRALTQEYPLRVLYFDGTKKQFRPFESRLVARNEFFLEIEGPSLEISGHFLMQAQPLLEVWFQKGGKEYRFETKCWFAAPPPDNTWYLEHSRKLQRVDLIDNANLSGVLLYSSSEEADVEEYPISMQVLDYIRIQFTISIKDVVLQTQGYAVINFKLKETEVACQGIITAIKPHQIEGEESEQMQYTVSLKDLSENNLNAILSFMRNPQSYLF